MVNKIKSFKFYKRFYQNWWISFLFEMEQLSKRKHNQILNWDSKNELGKKKKRKR